MAKFSGPAATMGRLSRTTGPLRAGGSMTWNDEGAPAYVKNAKTELFTAVVSAFATEGSFYESGDDRAKRVRGLVEQISGDDPLFIVQLIPWLRNVANMRTASIMVAVDHAAAGGRHARGAVNAACQRADEPGELLGYWLATHGRRIPMAVKKGLADACRRLYTERNVIKWDGQSKGIRFADVIELAHPKPKAAWQNALFRHCIDRRHNRDDVRSAHPVLPLLLAAYQLDALPEGERRPRLRESGAAGLADAGYTWERLAGWLPGGMDAEAWEAVIPSMGYMALLRNLRNFEQVGISEAAHNNVIRTLTDPEQVARSRQFPYRFWSAYRNSGSLRYAWAIEQALDLSCANVPKMAGRTLVMADSSGSMVSPVSLRSAVNMSEIGILFAAAMAKANPGTVDLALYDTTSRRFPIQLSVLRTVEGALPLVRGGGTHTWPSVREQYKGHDRVLVFSDMGDHAHPDQANLGGVPDGVPVYVWDLQGYRAANLNVGSGRHLLSGFTDTMFRLLPLLEAGRNLDWDALFSMGAADDGD